VSICASCISVFLISMEQNKKPCKKSVPNEWPTPRKTKTQKTLH
jgi:hypothetical protein